MAILFRHAVQRDQFMALASELADELEAQAAEMEKPQEVIPPAMPP